MFTIIITIKANLKFCFIMNVMQLYFSINIKTIYFINSWLKFKTNLVVAMLIYKIQEITLQIYANILRIVKNLNNR